jgi:hypothetical protein
MMIKNIVKNIYGVFFVMLILVLLILLLNTLLFPILILCEVGRYFLHGGHLPLSKADSGYLLLQGVSWIVFMWIVLKQRGNLRASIELETGVFNFKEIKENFINDVCFGEDFAMWLRNSLVDEKLDFELSELIQEDYGWGFWAEKNKDSFWIAVGCEGATKVDTAFWHVFISYDPALSITKRLFHKPNQQKFIDLVDAVHRQLKTNSAISVIEDE